MDKDAARLTDIEKKVLTGLSRRPYASDEELSRLTGINRSTATAARNRLKNEGYYRISVAPDFRGIGCELITIFHGDFNPSTPYELRKQYLPSQRFEQIFFVATSDLQHVSMSAALNFTETQRYEEFMESVYGEHRFLQPEGNDYAHFPLELSTTHRFFDYSQAMAKHLGAAAAPEAQADAPAQPVRLRVNEAKTLCALVEAPEAADTGLAEATGLSRQSVSTIRQRLLEKGVIRPLFTPNIRALGFEFLVFRHHRYLPASDPAELKRRIQETVNDPNTIFAIANNSQAATICVYPDYREYEAHERRTQTLLKGQLKGAPKTRVFSVRDLHLTQGRYGPLARRTVGQ